MKTASIVVPCWITGLPGLIVPDGDELQWFAANCFDRVARFTKNVDYELIVVDNGSTTGIDVMKQYADIYIRNETNLGFGRACNQGFDAATGEFVVCMNNDIFVYEDWLYIMIQEYREYADKLKIGVLSPTFDSERNARTTLMHSTIPVSKGAPVRGMQQAALWMIQSSFFKELHAKYGYWFDPNFHFGFGEDVDLWKRVRLARRDLFFTTNVKVFHQLNTTLGKIPEWGEYTKKSMVYLESKKY